MKIRKNTIFNVILVVALALRLLSETTANISFFMLAFAATFGRKEAILALFFSWFFTMINPGIAPVAALGAVGRYAIIFTSAASVLLRYRPAQYRAEQRRIILITFALGVFFLGHSLLFSAVPDVSVLKAISWVVTVTTLIIAWGGLSEDQSGRLLRQLLSGLTMIMLLSLPLLVLPVGYLVNGHGFQGVLNQPQAFGPTMSLLGVWVVMGMLALSRPPWKLVILAGACFALILLSESRTAGFAMVGGVIASIIVTAIFSKQSAASLLPGLLGTRSFLIILLSTFLVIAFAPKLADGLHIFVSKGKDVDSVLSAYDNSRGKLIDEMWGNIQAYPLTGIGFGIASNPLAMKIRRDPIFDLPVGASIEKGVLPIAILEEVGLFGFLLVLLWFWSVFRRALYSGAAAVGLLVTVILLNFGESVLFSVGGFGMLPLILLGWVAARECRFQDE